MTSVKSFVVPADYTYKTDSNQELKGGSHTTKDGLVTDGDTYKLRNVVIASGDLYGTEREDAMEVKFTRNGNNPYEQKYTSSTGSADS